MDKREPFDPDIPRFNPRLRVIELQEEERRQRKELREQEEAIASLYQYLPPPSSPRKEPHFQWNQSQYFDFQLADESYILATPEQRAAAEAAALYR